MERCPVQRREIISLTALLVQVDKSFAIVVNALIDNVISFLLILFGGDCIVQTVGETPLPTIRNQVSRIYHQRVWIATETDLRSGTNAESISLTCVNWEWSILCHNTIKFSSFPRRKFFFHCVINDHWVAVAWSIIPRESDLAICTIRCANAQISWSIWCSCSFYLNFTWV